MFRAAAVTPTSSSVIFGCRGAALTEDERAFFAEARPWGFILFARNVETPDQLRRLTDALRDAVAWRAPILIDQEGGRVARLKPPHWRGWAAAGVWADAVDRPAAAAADEATLLEGLRLRHQMIATELAAVGIDVDCVPLLDIRRDGAHDVIGDRAIGRTAEAVIRRAGAVVDGVRLGGVLPVVKHMPGHGRAMVDTHHALPFVDTPRETLAKEDFAPFRAFADQPLGMTAHLVYSAIDPERCATQSPTVIGDVIRREIGFDGFLMTDDLSMRALGGDFETRARACLDAGCDAVLHCNGDMDEMAATLRGVRSLSGDALRRGDAALAARPAPEPYDRADVEKRVAAIEASLGAHRPSA